MINGKKVIAVTLARGGSKTIPKKNMADINGTPLIGYTINEVIKSSLIDEYYVSTDDESTINYCISRDIKYLKRPAELCTDKAKSSDALIHAVRFMNCHYVVEIMATNPLKAVEDIDACIIKLDTKGVQSVVSVARVFDHHPSRVKYIEKGRLKNFYPEIPESRRQDLTPEAYIRNGSIYAMEKIFLLHTQARYDKNTVAYVMPPERTINIDEPEDLMLARLRLARS